MASSRIRAIFGVAGVVFLAKILGLGREMVIADKFGTSTEYDLYLIAVMLPALAYGVINFASFYLFVPYLTRKFEGSPDGDQISGWKASWPIFNFSLTASISFTVLIVLAAPFLMKIWGGEFGAEEFDRIVFYSRLTALMVVLGTSEAFMRAALNVRKVFTYPAASPIIFNLVSIASIVMLYRDLSIGAVVVGLLAGMSLQNVYLFVRLLGFSPFAGFSRSLMTDEVKAVLSTAGILVIIEMLNRSYFMIDRYFAPGFGEGIISGLNYSQVLVQLPDAIVGFAIASVLFPLFSNHVEGEDDSRFLSVYRNAVTAGVVVAAPLAAFFFVYASEIVHLFFVRGVFDENSLAITASILRPYTPTIVALFIVSTSIRACYGRGWAKMVLVFTVILFATKIVATALLPNWFGYPGISAATSVSQVAFAVSMLVFIIKGSSRFEKVGITLDLTRIVLAGVVAGAVMFFAGDFLPSYTEQDTVTLRLLVLATHGAVLFSLYLVVALSLGLKPIIELLRRARKLGVSNGTGIDSGNSR